MATNSRLTGLVKGLVKTLIRSEHRNSFAHVINPFKCEEDNPSYLYYAQPITFKSMYDAKVQARKQRVKIRLYSINFPQDDDIVPDYFHRLPHLVRSTKTEYPTLTNRQLPFVSDILGSLYDNTDADYLIFTNSDIGVQQSFYVAIDDIVRSGHDAFVINRRDNIPKSINNQRMTERNLDIIRTQSGVPHPGFDCFIFHRQLFNYINLTNMFTGFPPWGNLLKQELGGNAQNFKIFTNLHETFHIGCDLAWKSETKHELWLQNIRNANAIGYQYAL